MAGFVATPTFMKYRNEINKPFIPLQQQTARVFGITVAIIIVSLAFAILTGCATPQMPRKHVLAKKPTKHTTRARVTFYSGKHEHVAMNGKRAIQGESAAAHPKYAFGTQVKIPDLFKFLGDDTFTIEDRGSAVTRKTLRGPVDVIDIYCRNYSTMKKLEREAPEYMEVTIL